MRILCVVAHDDDERQRQVWERLSRLEWEGNGLLGSHRGLGK